MDGDEYGTHERGADHGRITRTENAKDHRIVFDLDLNVRHEQFHLPERVGTYDHEL